MMRPESSSPFSKSEATEKYEENQTGARERNLSRELILNGFMAL